MEGQTRIDLIAAKDKRITELAAQKHRYESHAAWRTKQLLKCQAEKARLREELIASRRRELRDSRRRNGPETLRLWLEKRIEELEGGG